METLTLLDICRLLKKRPQSIYNDLRRNPQAIPPRLAVPGTRRLLWDQKTVERWFQAHAPHQPDDVFIVDPQPEPRGRRRGRPRTIDTLVEKSAATKATADSGIAAGDSAVHERGRTR